jgi:hypothetical protein
VARRGWASGSVRTDQNRRMLAGMTPDVLWLLAGLGGLIAFDIAALRWGVDTRFSRVGTLR